MNAIEALQRVNDSFQSLLAAPGKALFMPAHGSDDLMVWFLLGGKDVGKSTFLNALLGTQVSGDEHGEAEGTKRFVAYVHESARRELEARLAGLPVDRQYHTHASEAHRRLCLIDSPDFDSRFARHASQVRDVLAAGVADGAVMVASPAKYKDLNYWSAFSQLSGALTPNHILFVLTKADELGDYLDEVRADFGRTIVRRMAEWESKGGEAERAGRPQAYLINSIDRDIDFARLDSRLMKKLSADEVRSAQRENLRHVIVHGTESIRTHYGLDRIGERLASGEIREAQEELFEETFPPAYFQALAARLAARREIVAELRDRLWSESGGTLAGVPTLQSIFRRLDIRPLFRLRSAGSKSHQPEGSADLGQLLRWGQEDLESRLATAQGELLSTIKLDSPEATAPYLAEARSILSDVEQLLEDHLARPTLNILSRPMRLLLNLPVILYLVFFITLLFYPALLLLQAWNLMEAPAFQGILTLDNVKISVIGFAGYYVMAVFYVIRKGRDRARLETETLADRFAADLAEILRAEAFRPSTAFAEDFHSLEERLNRCTDV